MMTTQLLSAPQVTIRPELGDFSSIRCFKALVVGIEEALGEKAAAIALLSAGRARGRNLAQELGLKGSALSFDEVTTLLQQTLGKEGTRLCIVDKIVEVGDRIQVSCHETVCSAGEEPGSGRKLSFTLGAIQGALEQLTGKRLRGKQIESVLTGSQFDVVEFETLG